MSIISNKTQKHNKCSEHSFVYFVTKCKLKVNKNVNKITFLLNRITLNYLILNMK